MVSSKEGYQAERILLDKLVKSEHWPRGKLRIESTKQSRFPDYKVYKREWSGVERLVGAIELKTTSSKTRTLSPDYTKRMINYPVPVVLLVLDVGSGEVRGAVFHYNCKKLLLRHPLATLLRALGFGRREPQLQCFDTPGRVELQRLPPIDMEALIRLFLSL